MHERDSLGMMHPVVAPSAAVLLLPRHTGSQRVSTDVTKKNADTGQQERLAGRRDLHITLLPVS